MEQRTGRTVSIEIRGQEYVVTSEAQFEAHGETRARLMLRKPNGTQRFMVVRYGNGVLSDAVAL